MVGGSNTRILHTEALVGPLVDPGGARDRPSILNVHVLILLAGVIGGQLGRRLSLVMRQ